MHQKCKVFLEVLKKPGLNTFLFQPRKTLKKQDYLHRYQTSEANSQIPKNEDNIYSYSKIHLTDEVM